MSSERGRRIGEGGVGFGIEGVGPLFFIFVICLNFYFIL